MSKRVIVVIEDIDDDICDYCDNTATYKFTVSGRSICSCPCHVLDAINSLFSH